MVKEIVKTTDEKMNKTISVLKNELSSMKAGRANPKMLDRIEIECYGSMMPLNQVAGVSAPEPRVLLIQPWDKGSIKEIEKAILKSDLGLNPSSDGSIIRLIIPELTEETRKNLVKSIKKVGEEAKVAVRAIRRDANDKIKALKRTMRLAKMKLRKQKKIYKKKLISLLKK